MKTKLLTTITEAEEAKKWAEDMYFGVEIEIVETIYNHMLVIKHTKDLGQYWGYRGNVKIKYIKVEPVVSDW